MANKSLLMTERSIFSRFSLDDLYTLVMSAVMTPIRDPSPTDPKEIVKKLSIVRKNASTSNESGSPKTFPINENVFLPKNLEA